MNFVASLSASRIEARDLRWRRNRIYQRFLERCVDERKAERLTERYLRIFGNCLED